MANILKLKERKFICLSKNEILGLFRISKMPKLLQGLAEKGAVRDLLLDKDKKKAIEVVGLVARDSAEDRDEHEIYVALKMLDFYPDNAMACFEMKDNFNIETKIVSIKVLVENRKISTVSDFAIIAGDTLRDFQLKRYRKSLDTKELFGFIQEQIQHYGNNLGRTNLFILLQSPEKDLKNLDFEEIQKRLSRLKFRSEAQVLIGYNENNEFFVVNQVYPGLTRSQCNAHTW
jgi:hypothetical protein